MAAMIGRLHHVIMDGQDPMVLASFYSELLGLPIYVPKRRLRRGRGQRHLFRPGFPACARSQPPAWPDPSRPQQVHFDIMVEDVAASGPRVLALGATKLDGGDVSADPSGHPFCLIRRPKWAPPVPQ